MIIIGISRKWNISFTIGLFVLTFLVFVCQSCYNTYHIDRLHGWWRNYMHEVSLGYDGTYSEFVRSLYLNDILDSLIFAILTTASIIAICIILFLIIRFCKYHFATNSICKHKSKTHC